MSICFFSLDRGTSHCLNMGNILPQWDCLVVKLLSYSIIGNFVFVSGFILALPITRFRCIDSRHILPRLNFSITCLITKCSFPGILFTLYFFLPKLIFFGSRRDPVVPPAFKAACVPLKRDRWVRLPRTPATMQEQRSVGFWLPALSEVEGSAFCYWLLAVSYPRHGGFFASLRKFSVISS